eukprot:2629908-Pyramimonas_sp.AAC.1
MPAGSSFDACVDAVKMNQPPCQAGGRLASPAHARGACRRGHAMRKSSNVLTFGALSLRHISAAGRSRLRLA